jgi:Carboxypeptidase regulatory-like domain
VKLMLASLIALTLFSFQEAVRPSMGIIKGVVRELNGMPVPGAKVYAYYQDNMRKRTADVTTDSNGRFVLDNLLPGVLYVRAYKESAGFPDTFFSFFDLKDNRKASQLVTVEAGKTSSELVIELGPKYATLELSIQDEQGNPIDGALKFTREDDPSRPYWRGVNSEGAYLVPPLPFRLEIEAKGYQKWHYNDGKNRQDSDLIKLRSGETMSLTAHLKKSR